MNRFLRSLILFLLLMAATALQAAEDAMVSKIAGNSLEQVRGAMETFCSQAPANAALRSFTSPAFWSDGVRQSANKVTVRICDCGTHSPCYEISAVNVSPDTTRIEVRSLDASLEDGRLQFRPKRNVRVLEELVRLLEKKP